jgi:hypothetical protein
LWVEDIFWIVIFCHGFSEFHEKNAVR